MSPCILWHKCLDARGYGVTYRDGKVVKAHRTALADHLGLSLADIVGQVVRHSCDTPACINPEHLSLGTQQDNVDDMVARGRHVGTTGTEFVLRLSLEDRQFIRDNHKPRCKEFGTAALARRFGVARGSIGRYIK